MMQKLAAVWHLVSGRGHPGVAAALLLVAGVSGFAAPDRGGKEAPPPPEVQRVLDRLDRAQRTIQTFRADVLETRTLSLLSSPQIFRGKVSFERPGKIRWEYTDPDERVYVLADGRLTGWIPAKNQVEEVNVSRYERRIRRIIAFGQESDALLRDFRISLANPSGAPDTDELVLAPRSRRVRRKIQEVRIAVDRKTGLPRCVQYETPQKDTVRIDFRNISVNRGLAPDTFALNIPPGAQVIDGLKSLGFDALEDDESSSNQF